MRASVVISLNEEAAIGGGVGKVPRDLLHEIIVVDKGSTDPTAALASAAGARYQQAARVARGRRGPAPTGARPSTPS